MIEPLRHGTERFRQLGSKMPDHPKYHLTSGVETTAGGCGSVGMAECATLHRLNFAFYFIVGAR